MNELRGKLGQGLRIRGWTFPGSYPPIPVKHLMGWTLWYYDHVEFPVLQAVYPDRENRFPEESGFDPAFAQPLMQPGSPMTDAEDDFWAFG